jgi:hypothetical protein
MENFGREYAFELFSSREETKLGWKKCICCGGKF